MTENLVTGLYTEPAPSPTQASQEKDTSTQEKEPVPEQTPYQLSKELQLLTADQDQLEYSVNKLEVAINAPEPKIDIITTIIHDICTMDEHYDRWTNMKNTLEELQVESYDALYHPNRGSIILSSKQGQQVAIETSQLRFRIISEVPGVIDHWITSKAQTVLDRTTELLNKAVNYHQKLTNSFPNTAKKLDTSASEQLADRAKQVNTTDMLRDNPIHIETIGRELPPRKDWAINGRVVDNDGKLILPGNWPELPVFRCMDTLVEKLATHPVVVLESATGTGKSTGAVGAIQHALCNQHSSGKRVIQICQPNRAAVHTLAKTLADYESVRLGDEVACKLKGRGKEPGMQPSPKTEVVYMVNQTFLNQIIASVRSTGRLPIGILDIDEAHLGDSAISTAMSICKVYLPYSPNTKLLIKSATINTEMFAQFFQDDEILPEGAEVIHVPSEGSVVDITVNKLKNYEHHTQGAIRVAKQLLNKMLKSKEHIEQGNPQILTKNIPELFTTISPQAGADIIASNSEVSSIGIDGQGLLADAERLVCSDGTLAVMVAGKEDVSNAMENLANEALILGLITQEEYDRFSMADRYTRCIKNRNIEILPAHSGVAKEDQEKLRKATSAGTIRIVCSTGDIIRNSITIPDLIGLVDSCMVKRPKINEKGANTLETVTISWAEMTQALGRLCRIRTTLPDGRSAPIPGNYYPIDLATESSREPKYKNYNEIVTDRKMPIPEICQTTLTLPTLWLAAAGIPIRNAQFPLEPGHTIPPERIDQAINRLQKIGALYDDETITPFGEKIVNLPLEPELAASLFKAEEIGLTTQACVVTAAISNERPIQHIPRKETTMVYNHQEIVQILSSEKFKYHFQGNSVEENIDFAIKNRWISYDDDQKTYKITAVDRYSKKDNNPFNNFSLFDYFWKDHYAGKTNSDFVAIVRAYTDYRRAAGKKTPNQMEPWLISHCLDPAAFKGMDSKLKDLIEELEKTDLSFEWDRLDENHLIDIEELANKLSIIVAAGSVDNVSKLTSSTEGYYSPATADSGYKPSHLSACPSTSSFIVYGGKAQQRHKQLAEIAYGAPIDADILSQAMPYLIQEQLKPDSLVIKKGVVYGQYVINYCNTTINDISRPVEGILAVNKIIEAIRQSSINNSFHRENNNVLARLKELNKKAYGIHRFDTYSLYDKLIQLYREHMLKNGVFNVSQLQEIEDQLTISDDDLSAVGIPNITEIRTEINKRPDTWIIEGEDTPFTLSYINREKLPGQYTEAKPGVIIRLGNHARHQRIPWSQLPDIPGLMTYVEFYDTNGHLVSRNSMESTTEIESRQPQVLFDWDFARNSTDIDEDGKIILTPAITLRFNKGRDGETIDRKITRYDVLQQHGRYSPAEYMVYYLNDDGVEESTKVSISEGGNSIDPFQEMERIKREPDSYISKIMDYIDIMDDFKARYQINHIKENISTLSNPERVYRVIEYRITCMKTKEHELSLEEKEQLRKLLLVKEEIETLLRRPSYMVSNQATSTTISHHAIESEPSGEIKQKNIMALIKNTKEDLPQEELALIETILTKNQYEKAIDIITNYLRQNYQVSEPEKRSHFSNFGSRLVLRSTLQHPQIKQLFFHNLNKDSILDKKTIAALAHMVEPLLLKQLKNKFLEIDKHSNVNLTPDDLVDLMKELLEKNTTTRAILELYADATTIPSWRDLKSEELQKRIYKAAQLYETVSRDLDDLDIKEVNARERLSIKVRKELRAMVTNVDAELPESLDNIILSNV
ncbi:MAG: DEAD/DEAH box helicase [Patescibacteria group bacterium]